MRRALREDTSAFGSTTPASRGVIAIGSVMVILASCAESAGVDSNITSLPSTSGDGGGGGAAPSTQFTDGATDAARVPTCGDPLQQEGCPCKPGAAPRPCYEGPPTQAGVGSCSEGTQTCVAKSAGEFAAGSWGPCVGSGHPTTCSAVGASCGTIGDGCGGVLDCGGCASGLACGAQSPNTCGTGACMLKTCAALGVECGTASDGCTGTLDCGSCVAPAVCGGGGNPGKCDAPPPPPPPPDAGTVDAGPHVTCGPLQQFQWTSDYFQHAHPPIDAPSADACQAFCNSFSDTLCCMWEQAPGYNGLAHPCWAFNEPSCIPVWWNDPLGSNFWGTLCQ